MSEFDQGWVDEMGHWFQAGRGGKTMSALAYLGVDVSHDSENYHYWYNPSAKVFYSGAQHELTVIHSDMLQRWLARRSPKGALLYSAAPAAIEAGR